MSDKPRLLFLAGSTRQQSFNRRLAALAAALAREQQAEVTLVELSDYPMPLYNGDLEEQEGLPPAARELKALFRDCDGFFIASPEYNSCISPLLKNTLDWISRSESRDEPPLVAYKGKVAALAATSPGMLGGLRGLVHLRMMLGAIGVHMLPDQLAVPQAMKAFAEDGTLADERHQRTLRSIVSGLAETSRRMMR